MKTFEKSGLMGAARYLRQRAVSVKKPHKRETLEAYAEYIEVASAHIEKLELALKRK